MVPTRLNRTYNVLRASQTESALQAAKSFYCDLCGKGYSRINEYEAHEGSYDHLHKKVVSPILPSFLKHSHFLVHSPSAYAQNIQRKDADSLSFDQRLKEMKLMSRDPLASTKARKAERKANESVQVINIKLAPSNAHDSGRNGGGGFKKGGFRNAFGSGEEKEQTDRGEEHAEVEVEEKLGDEGGEEVESEDEEGMYDPRQPTGC